MYQASPLRLAYADALQNQSEVYRSFAAQRRFHFSLTQATSTIVFAMASFLNRYHFVTPGIVGAAVELPAGIWPLPGGAQDHRHPAFRAGGCAVFY